MKLIAFHNLPGNKSVALRFLLGWESFFDRNLAKNPEILFQHVDDVIPEVRLAGPDTEIDGDDSKRLWTFPSFWKKLLNYIFHNHSQIMEHNF